MMKVLRIVGKVVAVLLGYVLVLSVLGAGIGQVEAAVLAGVAAGGLFLLLWGERKHA